MLTAVEVIVRDLRPDDWAEVAEIYRDGTRSGLATFEIEVPSWEDWRAAHTIGTHACDLVAYRLLPRGWVGVRDGIEEHVTARQQSK